MQHQHARPCRTYQRRQRNLSPTRYCTIQYCTSTIPSAHTTQHHTTPHHNVTADRSGAERAQKRSVSWTGPDATPPKQSVALNRKDAVPIPGHEVNVNALGKPKPIYRVDRTTDIEHTHIHNNQPCLGRAGRRLRRPQSVALNLFGIKPTTITTPTQKDAVPLPGQEVNVNALGQPTPLPRRPNN